MAAIAIQSNQNDMHGGQSIPNFDYGMAEGVAKSFVKNFRQKLTEAVEEHLDIPDGSALTDQAISVAEEETGRSLRLEPDAKLDIMIAASIPGLSNAFDPGPFERGGSDQAGQAPGVESDRS